MQVIICFVIGFNKPKSQFAYLHYRITPLVAAERASRKRAIVSVS